MNNKGWGLGEMLGLCAILVFALLVSVVIYQNAFDDPILDNGGSTASNYAELELNAENAAYNYVINNNINTKVDIYIPISQLLEEEYIEKFEDDKGHKCSGYVNYNGVDYTAYIKCSIYYKTSGYISKLDK